VVHAPLIIDGGTVTNTGNFYSLLGPVTFTENGGTLTATGSYNQFGAWSVYFGVTAQGDAVISGGIVALAKWGQTSTAPITVAAGKTLTVSSPLVNLVYSNSEGRLTKQGDGTLILTGTGNTYTGNTTVNAGELQINGSKTGTSGTVTVNSGGTLAGSGTMARPVVVESGGTLRGGTGTGNADDLTLSSALTMNDGAKLDVTASATDISQVKKTSAGKPTGSGTMTVNLLNSMPGVGPLTLISTLSGLTYPPDPNTATTGTNADGRTPIIGWITDNGLVMSFIAPAADKSGVRVAFNLVQADGVSFDKLEVMARDSSGVAVPGARVDFAGTTTQYDGATPGTVTFYDEGGGNGQSAGAAHYCITGSNGVCQVWATSTTVGYYQIAASVNGNALTGDGGNEFTANGHIYYPTTHIPGSIYGFMSLVSPEQSAVRVETNWEPAVTGFNVLEVVALNIIESIAFPINGVTVTFAGEPGVQFCDYQNQSNCRAPGEPATCVTGVGTDLDVITGRGLCRIKAKSATPGLYQMKASINDQPLMGYYLNIVNGEEWYYVPTNHQDARYMFRGNMSPFESGVRVVKNHAKILVGANPATAENYDILEAMVRDWDQNPVSNAPVVFKATDKVTFCEAANGTAGNDCNTNINMDRTCVTGADGTCQIAAKSAERNFYQINAWSENFKLAGSFQTDTGIFYWKTDDPIKAVYRFIDGELLADNSGIRLATFDTSTDGTLWGDPAFLHVIEVRIQDKNQVPQSGKQVEFSRPSGFIYCDKNGNNCRNTEAGYGTATCTTDLNGVCYITARVTASEKEADIHVSVDGNELGGYFSVDYPPLKHYQPSPYPVRFTALGYKPYPVKGDVFADNGAGGGTAHDGVKNGAETGFDGGLGATSPNCPAIEHPDNPRVTIYKDAPDGELMTYKCMYLKPDGAFDFGITVDSAAINSTTYMVAEKVPASYTPISEKFDTNAEWTTDPSVFDNRIKLLNKPATTNQLAGVGFGFVRPPAVKELETEKTTPAASPVNHKVTFDSFTAGSMVLEAAAAPDPLAPPVGWTIKAFRDINGDGVIEPAEGDTEITATDPLLLAAGATEPVVLVQVTPPPGASGILYQQIKVNATTTLTSGIDTSKSITAPTVPVLEIITKTNTGDPKPVQVYKGTELLSEGDTLKAAFDYINAQTWSGEDLIVKINASTSETATATLDSGGGTGYGTVTVTPTAAGLTVGKAAAFTGTHLIDLRADVIFDTAHELTVDGSITGAAGADLTKTGTAALILTGTAHNYLGLTILTTGEVRLAPGADATFASSVLFNGGTLSTTGITTAGVKFGAKTGTGTLQLNNDSIIALKPGLAHTLNFAGIGATWANNKLLVTGWLRDMVTGGGKDGKLFIGEGQTLNATQLARITFQIGGFEYDAVQLDTGEVVAIGIPDPTPEDFYWDGTDTAADNTVDGGTGEWNGISTNWTNVSGTTNSAWRNSTDIAFFTKTGGTVTVEAGYTAPIGGLTFTIDGYTVQGEDSTATLHGARTASNNTLTANANVSATVRVPLTGGNFEKTGAGAITLAGNNTYTGTTLIREGTVIAGHDSALGDVGAGTTVGVGPASTATLALPGDRTIAEPLTIMGKGFGETGALKNIAGNNTYTGAIHLATNSTIGADAGNLTLQGGVTGVPSALTIAASTGSDVIIENNAIANTVSSLVKEGDGTLIFNMDAAFTGPTTITAGTLNLNGTTQTLSRLTGNGTLALPTVGANTSGLTINSSADNNTLAAITGAGTITVTGTGTGLALTGQDGKYTSYTGATTVDTDATLKLNPANNVTGFASPVVLADGATLSTVGTGAYNWTSPASTATLGVSGTATLALDTTNAHELHFAGLGTWDNTPKLIITGWQGSAGMGTTGEYGKIFIGGSALTQGRLDLITFEIGSKEYPAKQLSSGEVVAASSPVEVYGASGFLSGHPTLADAFAAISNDTTTYTDDLSVRINQSTMETATATLTDVPAGFSRSVTVFPTTTGITVRNTTDSSADFHKQFYGEDNRVVFDGRVNGSGSSGALTLDNGILHRPHVSPMALAPPRTSPSRIWSLQHPNQGPYTYPECSISRETTGSRARRRCRQLIYLMIIIASQAQPISTRMAARQPPVTAGWT
jgi:autotransporter-associated beta strand protein